MHLPFLFPSTKKSMDFRPNSAEIGPNLPDSGSNPIHIDQRWLDFGRCCQRHPQPPVMLAGAVVYMPTFVGRCVRPPWGLWFARGGEWDELPPTSAKIAPEPAKLSPMSETLEHQRFRPISARNRLKCGPKLTYFDPISAEYGSISAELGPPQAVEQQLPRSVH